MKWHELTGQEVADLAKTTDLAVLPIGSVEMHGPHLPTGSDSFIAEHVCERIAEEVPCIVLPTMYYNINSDDEGLSGRDLYFAGCSDSNVRLDLSRVRAARIQEDLRSRMPRRIGDPGPIPCQHSP